MSRCFPYPPPGYTPSRARKEALIESIKLQKEQEKAKAQKKKEKRREKENERKERKDEINEKTNQKTHLNSKKRRKTEEGNEEKNGRKKEREGKPDLNSNKLDFHKGQIGEDIWAQRELERSGLTEEHDRPICLHLPSASSESTENSSKRKRPSSPGNVIQGHGTIIRIQLSSKKQIPSDISTNERQLCTTSGRMDVPSLRNQQPNFCVSAEKTTGFVQGDFHRTEKKQIVSVSGKSQPAAPGKTDTPPYLDAIEGSKKSSSESEQYKNLIENWVPPLLQDAPLSSQDLDWLICSKDHILPERRRRRVENDTLLCSGSLLQPRAQLLPEIDMYALPFTVPY